MRSEVERVCPTHLITQAVASLRFSLTFSSLRLRQLRGKISHLLSGFSEFSLLCSHPDLGLAISHALPLGKI